MLLQFLKKHLFLVLCILLILSYFSIGAYLITTTPITSDETAHLSAAHAYISGQGLNPEHPPLLKLLNSFALDIFFPTLSSERTNQWERSWDFLNSDYSFWHILWVSRSVYLVFNALILFWIGLYTFVYKWLDPKFSLILSALYVFSPSFFSHNYLITFDVASSSTVIGFFLATIFLIKQTQGFKLNIPIIHYILPALWFTLAIGTKFSNIIIALISLVLIGIGTIYYATHKEFDQVKNLLKLAILFISLSSIIILGTYAWAFRNYSAPIIESLEPLNQGEREIVLLMRKTPRVVNIYLEGLMMSKFRSGDKIWNFIDDQYILMPFREFVVRVFWFKENPVLIVTVISILTYYCYKLIRRLRNQQMSLTGKNLVELIRANPTLSLIYFLALSYPLVFFLVSLNSYLTIGYRHFYPVLGLIYVGIAVFLYQHFKRSRVILTALFFAYIMYGYLAIPYGLSYTNPFWTKDFWRLASDSTTYWGQNDYKAWEFLVHEKGLSSNNNVQIVSATWHNQVGIVASPEQNLQLVTGKNIQSQRNYQSFDIRHQRISERTEKYLIVDISSWQKAESAKNEIVSKENLDYLNSNHPIFSYQNTTFIYQLRQ